MSDMSAALPPARVSSQPSGRYSLHDSKPGRESLPSDSLAGSLDPKVRRQQAEALWNKAEAQFRRGDLPSALQTARTAVKLGHSAPEHDALLGWLIFQHGAGDESVLPHVWKCIDRALKRDPLCEQALFYKGMLFSQTGNSEQALAHLQRVLTLNPKHIEAQREIRIAQMRQEHERQQSGFFQRLLNARPTGKDGE
jgi:cytochrome c-type biogenesis protein CcmH/NrfG